MTEIIKQSDKMIILCLEDNRYQVFHYQTMILELDSDNNELTYLYLPSPTSTRIAKQSLNEIFGESVDEKYWKEMKTKLKSGTK